MEDDEDSARGLRYEDLIIRIISPVFISSVFLFYQFGARTDYKDKSGEKGRGITQRYGGKGRNKFAWR